MAKPTADRGPRLDFDALSWLLAKMLGLHGPFFFFPIRYVIIADVEAFPQL